MSPGSVTNKSILTLYIIHHKKNINKVIYPSSLKMGIEKQKVTFGKNKIYIRIPFQYESVTNK